MRATDKQRGFTLLEIMVVIVIIGVLASLVVPNLMGNKEKADKQKAVSDIVALENALDMYKLDNHHYPTTNQGLESLVEAPTLPPLAANYNKEGYIKRLPADPWGNDYVLVNPGEHGAYDLLSAGPDGEMGTEDDITNWGLSKKKKQVSDESATRVYPAGDDAGAGAGRYHGKRGALHIWPGGCRQHSCARNSGAVYRCT